MLLNIDEDERTSHEKFCRDELNLNNVGGFSLRSVRDSDHYEA